MEIDSSKGKEKTSPRLIALSIVLSALIFIVDLSLPLGVAAGVPYITLVLISMWSPKQEFTIIMVITGTVLTMAGFLSSPAGGEMWKVLFNRFLALFAIWITAILALHYKRSKEELVERAESLAKAEEIANLGSWSWDILVDKITWSEQTCRIFGYEPGEITPSYKVFLSHVHRDDRKAMVSAIEKTLKENMPFNLEYRIVEKNGAERIIHSQGQLLLDKDDKPLKFFGTNQNITDQKEIENIVRASKEKYQTLLDNTSSVIYTLSADGKVTYISSAIERLSGHKHAAFMDVNVLWESFVNHEDLHKFRDHRQKLIVNKSPSKVQYRLKVKDGPTIWVDDNCVPIKDGDGNVIYFHGTVDDITTLKNLQQFKEDYFQTVVHDLKSPITGIKLELESINCYLEQINNSIKDDSEKLVYGTYEDQIKAKLKNTESGLDDIYRMIEGLLKIGEIEEEKLELSYESFGIEELFKKLELDFKQRLKEKRLELEINNVVVDDIVCDRNILKRVLQNLIDNAIKYSYSSTKISIDSLSECLRGDDCRNILISISNTGKPLSEKKVNAMFGKFRTQNEPESGSGIGLFFCYKTMEALEGSITVNTEGNTTEFIVIFPNG